MRPHGDPTNYQKYGCRCVECSQAQSAYAKRRRWAQANRLDPMVDATGTKRRIRALSAIGWRMADVFTLCGWSGNVSPWLLHSERVHRSTAAKVAKVYDELSMTPGPSENARRNARRLGFPPPLAWDEDTIDDPHAEPQGTRLSANTAGHVDPVAVAFCLDGLVEFSRLREVDRREVVKQWRRKGLGAVDIARLSGLKLDAVRKRLERAA